ncbi:uncharacterized protein TRIADDRAFT_62227 [Trichoplax adhaerens]|uniref:Thioredoxin domain-containing protein n=1 Tax=Trichoplax adhaerens TaxID=10228 RepID=B3SD69_TRIAD|nr:hypothetical protein TRIADDRAFT_62227 [Trichoplax adhaerens]EDV19346.1 hypothetical protein TRIADDRAFT_62227 [Trichoplax adhaerens]|eukprot:XP_002118197.1 hypothetical protein TRIADDRAFT_62227 [Trichoplax adhaerens]
MGVKSIETKEELVGYIQLSKNKLVVIDFYTVWCGPCRMIGPKFENLSNVPIYSNVIFLKVNVDQNSDISEDCNISAMPTFQFYKSGEKVDEVVGANEVQLKSVIEKHKGKEAIFAKKTYQF